MNDLKKKALIGVTQLQIVLAVLLFLPAGTFLFWQAWIYWVLFSASVLLITLHFLKHDPDLIRSRLAAGPGAERENHQKFIQAAASIVFCATMMIPGFEHRVHPSVIPLALVLAGDALAALGFLLIFFVFRENGHASSVIEVKAGQPVISTGPYALVRHPMYSGAVLLFLGTPFALGSLWALGCSALFCGVITARLLDEEQYLLKHLAGYTAYCLRVQFRLFPHIW